MAREEADRAPLGPLALAEDQELPARRGGHRRQERARKRKRVELEILGPHVLVERVEPVDLVFGERARARLEDLDFVGVVEGRDVARLVVAMLAAERRDELGPRCRARPRRRGSPARPSTSCPRKRSGGPARDRRSAGRAPRARRIPADPRRSAPPGAAARSPPGCSTSPRDRGARDDCPPRAGIPSRRPDASGRADRRPAAPPPAPTPPPTPSCPPFQRAALKQVASTGSPFPSRTT
jgi:hypothetical protein